MIGPPSGLTAAYTCKVEVNLRTSGLIELLYFGHNHDFFSRELILLDSLAQDDFRVSIRVYLADNQLGTDFKQHELNTHVRRVEGIDTGVVGSLDVLQTLLFWQEPRLPRRITVGHTAQDDLGHL